MEFTHHAATRNRWIIDRALPNREITVSHKFKRKMTNNLPVLFRNNRSCPVMHFNNHQALKPFFRTNVEQMEQLTKSMLFVLSSLSNYLTLEQPAIYRVAEWHIVWLTASQHASSQLQVLKCR